MNTSIRTQSIQNTAKAFTLIELLIVLTIIGLLAALVGPRLAGALGKGRVKTTQTQIELLSGSIEQFNMDTSRYPTEQEGFAVLLTRPQDVQEDAWQGPYLNKDFIPKDGWGRDFVYHIDEQGRFVIRSLGADGKEGGSGENADIDNRTS